MAQHDNDSCCKKHATKKKNKNKWQTAAWIHPICEIMGEKTLTHVKINGLKAVLLALNSTVFNLTELFCLSSVKTQHSWSRKGIEVSKAKHMKRWNSVKTIQITERAPFVYVLFCVDMMASLLQTTFHMMH